MNKFFNLATIIVGGIIVADLVANATGTKAFFDGASGLWKTSVNGLLGKTS